MGLTIVNIGYGSWYPKGTQRLAEKILDSRYNVHFRYSLPDHYPTQQEYPYAAKAMFIIDMFEKYGEILWLDCSLVPYKPIDQIIDYILNHPFTQKHGFYAYKTGMTIGQTCNDNALDRTIIRDYSLPEFASTMFYLKNPDIAENFKMLFDDDVIKGSRDYNPSESVRPDFKFHRQDQSLLSLSAHMNKVDHTLADNLGDVVQYNYPDITPDKSKLFLVAGGYGDQLPNLNFNI